MTGIEEPAEMFDNLLAFYCPLTAEVSPDAQRLHEGTLAWVERFDLGAGDVRQARMLAITGAAFGAQVTPHATGEIGQALADYSAWAWIPNELSGSGQPVGSVLATLGRWARIMGSPNSWPDSTDPRDVSLTEVVGRLQRLLMPVQWERFTAAQEAWIYAIGWEASLHATGKKLSVNDYLAMRIGSGGVHAADGYIDAVEGTELSAREWSDPVVRAAAGAGLFTAVLDNDRYSYLRERALPVTKYNLFEAVRYDHPDYTVEQALTEGIAIRDRLLTLYLQLRAHILIDAEPELHRYLTSIDRVISGNINFASSTTRYLLPDSPYKVTRVDTPSDPTTTPLPYPTIASWWDQLPH